MDPPPVASAVHHRDLVFGPEQDATCLGDGVSFVRVALYEWQPAVPADAVEAAVLVAAELLANAFQHAGGILRLDLDHRHGLMRIAVSDPSPDPPRPGTHQPGRIGGHGLFIIDRACLRWGHRRTPSGKTVWADVPLHP